MFRTPSKTEQAKGAVAAGAGKVTDGAQGAVDKAADLKVKAGVAAAATAIGAAVAKEKATDAAEVAREKAHEAAETMAPKVEHAREAFVEDVLPKLASAVAAIAAGAAAARETAAEAAERAPDAYAVLKGDAVAKKGAKGRWILLLGALAAGAAVMAWRKSNERPDPWATAGSYTPPKPVSEKVSDLAVAAKDKAAEVKDAAVDKAGELKDKASGAAGAAKDTASDARLPPRTPRTRPPTRPGTRLPTPRRPTAPGRRATPWPCRPRSSSLTLRSTTVPSTTRLLLPTPTPTPRSPRSRRAPRAPTCRPGTSTPAPTPTTAARRPDRAAPQHADAGRPRQGAAGVGGVTAVPVG